MSGEVDSRVTEEGPARTLLGSATPPPPARPVTGPETRPLDAAFDGPDAAAPTVGPDGMTVAGASDATMIPAALSARERIRIVPGRRLEGTPYQIVRLLGEGGMGSVYEAEHVDIGRRVALKILHPEYCRFPAVVKMFRDEARAASKIGSKYIIDVLDFDELADGRVLFAMEYVDSRTLGEDSREAQLDPARLIGILRQVCKGLGAAHRAGIVHRDVKPDNILLHHHDGREDQVKILDFGIALVTGEDSATKNQPMGTLEYMAPEQATGINVDHRADVYALGCTAFAALTGRPPFQSKGIAELLTLQVTEAAPTLADVRPDHGCPPALERVIRRALEKEPDDRYQSMDDLEAALCEAQIDAGLVTPWDDLPLPDVDPERRDRLLRSMPEPLAAAPPRRGPWILAAAAVLGLAGVGAAFVLQPDETPVAVAATDGPVKQLVNEARAAGARAYYVYPPTDDRTVKTAYQKVLALEAFEGDLAGPATAAAKDLRAEFAATLTRLGDHYWEEPGGEPFAADYYIQAVLFGAGEARLHERAPYTAGELADLRRRAASGEFREAELVAAETLQVLAEVEAAPAPERTKKLRKLARKNKKRRRAAGRAVLEEMLEAQGVAVDAEPAEAGEASPEPVGAAPTEDVAPTDDAAPGDRKAADAPAGATSDRPEPGNARKRAAALVSDARAAARSGKRDRALTLYNQAIDLHPGNDAALIGLSDLHFDRGDHRAAIRYAERAVRANPRKAGHHLKLGDALYKELRYSDALEAYREAGRLGSSSAAAKITKVEKRLGK